MKETCAKHGEQFADHFGEKGIADRSHTGLILRHKSISQFVKFCQQFAASFDFERKDHILRFRANLVVEGGGAFGEENWSGFQVAGAEFKVGGPCRR